MEVTLMFPTYIQLANFLSVSANAQIRLDLKIKALVGNFNAAETQTAQTNFNATVLQSSVDNGKK